ncbi:hypothetical protein ACN28S_20465 [Cystobacter fuscus]
MGLGAALLAAMSYTFSGYLVSITNNTLYLLAAVTVPWVFWALEGFLRAPTVGRGLGVAVLLGLVLLAGDVQGYAVCLGGALLWSMSRPASGGTPRALLGMLGVGLVSVLLCAVQILPTLAGLDEVRASNQTLAQATVWSVHPLRLVELLLGPLFVGESGQPVQVAISAWLLSTSRTELWADSFYLGAPALVLAGVALTRVRGPRAVLLLAAALGAVLLALGKHTPLYGWVFDWVPPWRTFRYPEKLMTFVTFAVCRRRAWGGSGSSTRPTSGAGWGSARSAWADWCSRWAARSGSATCSPRGCCPACGWVRRRPRPSGSSASTSCWAVGWRALACSRWGASSAGCARRRRGPGSWGWWASGGCCWPMATATRWGSRSCSTSRRPSSCASWRS